jgi:hypothetical protein
MFSDTKIKEINDSYVADSNESIVTDIYPAIFT